MPAPFNHPRLSRPRRLRALVFAAGTFSLAAPLFAQTPADPPSRDSLPTPDELRDFYETGQTLFENYAPAELKSDFRFPTAAEWNNFVTRLNQAMQTGSLAQIARYRPEAEAALAALRALPPEYQPFASWLQDRLDYIEAAQAITTTPPPSIPEPTVQPPVPHYDLWLDRLANRPTPANANRYLDDLEEIFRQSGLPPALVWIAEVESSFNPEARSPVGARGLFQIMPATAKELDLRLLPFDERTNPRKSARAAASYLDQLHTRFADWPLALAAYNAGPGRVSRTLRAHSASTYAAIAEHLPAETRMYVPKVLATITRRTGTPLALN